MGSQGISESGMERGSWDLGQKRQGLFVNLDTTSPRGQGMGQGG